tara:strand:- start:3867 stop:4121 length:255 start_codon:yes stop_codon:yes gene_type:complete
MSKHNIKSVVEFTDEDKEIELDIEFRKQLTKEMDEIHKEDDINNKCINLCADIRSYIDDNSLTNVIFTNLSVNQIKELLNEIYS